MAATSHAFASSLVISVVLLFWSTFNYVEAGSDALLPQGSPRCACANEELIFTCTIVGDGFTQWNGTAFDCTGSNNEILLSHNDYPNGASGRCNGGQITGTSLSVENNYYTSQLSVNTSAALNNKTIRCIYNTEKVIGTIVLTVISAGFNEPPGNVVLCDVQSGILMFCWSRVDPTNCALETYNITYNITYNGCGICRVGNNYSATCTDIQASITHTQCNFNVHSVVCGFPGTSSNSTVVNVMVPDNTSIQAIFPVYASDTQLLTKIATITLLIPFNFTLDMPGNTTHFNITFSSSDRTISINQSVKNSTEYRVKVPNSFCSSSSADVNVAIAAANRLGQGPPSQPYLFGCTNQFVRVEYDPDMSTITCVFLNVESQNSNIRRSCSIRYGACQQEFNRNAQGSTTVESPDRVALPNIMLGGSDCYSVNASNDTYAVIVEGTIDTGSGSRSNTAAIVAGVVIPLFACFVVIISIAIYVYVVRRRQSIPVRKEPIMSINDTFTVSEPVDSPDVPDAEPEVPIGKVKEDIEPPDEHAPVPEHIKKTVVQKTILDDFSAFV